MLQQSIDDLVVRDRSVAWSISIRDRSGRELAGRNSGTVLATASVGKLLLLIEVARQRRSGELDGATVLSRRHELFVTDSGLWQYLGIEALSIDDLCVLIAGVSDNLATNVLLDHVGLQSVRALGVSLGLVNTALLDRVRDERGAEHPEQLSVGSASELSRLMVELSCDAVISADVSSRVNAWLATGVDTSMVMSAFGLDPLAHTAEDRYLHARNKTGTDAGVRADVGVVRCRDVWLAYAVIANWDVTGRDQRDSVLTTMRRIGALLRAEVTGC